MITASFLLVHLAASAPATAREPDGPDSVVLTLLTVDRDAQRFRVRGRPCDLAGPLAVMRDHHGWRIATEAPLVVYAPDLMPAPGMSGGEQTCPRRLDLDVTYDAADPAAAVAAVVDAWNASDPPYTARVVDLVGLLRVVPVGRKGTDGNLEPVVPDLEPWVERAAARALGQGDDEAVVRPETDLWRRGRGERLRRMPRGEVMERLTLALDPRAALASAPERPPAPDGASPASAPVGPGMVWDLGVVYGPDAPLRVLTWVPVADPRQQPL